MLLIGIPRALDVPVVEEHAGPPFSGRGMRVWPGLAVASMSCMPLGAALWAFWAVGLGADALAPSF
jgi:hypothetical protein